MSINRVRAVVLGFMALLAVGSFGVSAASAEPGPFWHHRAVGGEGNGLKIDQPNDENFSGEGGEQTLEGEIGTLKTIITATSVQVKGVIYNNALQGQIKVLLKYHEPKLISPSLVGCEVKIGTNNEVKSEGHLAWKYQGNASELTEKPVTVQKPDIIFTPKEILAGETKLPEGTFTEINLFDASGQCGVLKGLHPVKGSLSSLVKPSNLGEWSTTLVTTYPGWVQQHYWNGSTQITAEPKLIFGTLPATLRGSATSKAEKQEIAVFEK